MHTLCAMPGCLPVPMLLAASCLLGALETPSSILAIASDSDEDCGGSAVIIDENGLAITLSEALPEGKTSFTVILSGGHRRTAQVVRRDPRSSAVLLQIADMPQDIQPMQLADSRRIQLMDPVWTAGNATDAITLDGAASISRGVVSGLYELPTGEPPVRGRDGSILATWSGPAFETDAAINDGNQGGALLDDAGHLLGLTSHAQIRERRLPLCVPLARILDGIDLPPANMPPSGSGAAWRRAAAAVAPSLGLVYMQRLRGPGNPDGVSRPPRLLDEATASERDRLSTWWERYWQQQQVFYTDQPVCVLSLGDDLLLTSASNLHGGAERGRLLLPGETLACTVIGRDLPLDLALLRCERGHGLPPTPFANSPPAIGTSVALLGRHRTSSSWTATLGTISATERRRAQSRLALLQTDARANYGSLGGALLNADGLVTGICVLLGPYDERPWLINSGVAMAVDAARIVAALPAMRAGKTIERPSILGLGVVLRNRSGKLVIEDVTAGTGAESAGLGTGDILRSVAGAPATSPDAIARVLLKHMPGDLVPVEILRAGKELTVQVELREFTP
jgi:S1-C subfamily serine protease